MANIKTKTVPVVFNKCIVITVPLCIEKAWNNVYIFTKHLFLSFYLSLFPDKGSSSKTPGGCSSQLLPVTTVHTSNCRRSLKARRLVTG